MSDPPTDDELLAAAQRSPAGFAAIFDRHHDAIFRFVAHRLDRVAAEDIASETFVRALPAIGRAHTTDGSLRAWLYAIAGNLTRDEYRRRIRSARADQRLQRNAADAHQASGAFPPDPELLDALRNLREEEQEALVLLAWGDLTYAEIAVATDVPIGTVRSRISRARGQLRATLTTTTTEQVR